MTSRFAVLSLIGVIAIGTACDNTARNEQIAGAEKSPPKRIHYCNLSD